MSAATRMRSYNSREPPPDSSDARTDAPSWVTVPGAKLGAAPVPLELPMAAIGSPTASVEEVPKFAVGNPKAPRRRTTAMSLARSKPITSTG